MEKQVCAIGGINIDIKGVAHGISADSNPGKIFISGGGVARNISENLARLGISVYLFGCIGMDEFGRRILDTSAKTGIETGKLLVSSEIKTAAYLSVSDSGGKLNYAVNDMLDSINAVNEDYIGRHLDFISKSGLIVLDANLNTDVLRMITETANRNNIPVFLDAVSIVKGNKIKNIHGVIDYLSVNSSELKSIFGADPETAIKDKNAKEYYRNIIIRTGKNGSESYNTESGITNRCKSFDIKVEEPNGAGDAFNAGFIYSVLNNYSSGESLVFGTCASYFALRSGSSVSDDITKEKLLKLFEESKGILT